MIRATAWAVIENGEINVRSICPTRIGAIVNFLITDRKVLILDGTPDHVVELRWIHHRGGAELQEILCLAKTGG